MWVIINCPHLSNENKKKEKYGNYYEIYLVLYCFCVFQKKSFILKDNNFMKMFVWE